MSIPHAAFPVVIAAPSGAGKTTLARALVERNDDMVFSVSATTRARRPREMPGRDYHFVDDDTFDRMIAANELAEWAVVHGKRYGTLRREVTRAMEQGKRVILDIDVQGARQVRHVFPDTLLIFVLPPSAEDLDRRLNGRASEDRDERRRRLDDARREITAVGEFDFVVENDDLEKAILALEGIIRAEGSSVRRLSALDAVVANFDRQLRELLEGSAG
ncbi:MAG TPA: guanylate kinase [Longimicrobiales bacterium]|nr:guanylate kinase [Longimicrobiales bacterium]